ncbi:MAG: hypothetical protein Q9187_004020 [Circinaria calcarea]
MESSAPQNGYHEYDYASAPQVAQRPDNYPEVVNPPQWSYPMGGHLAEKAGSPSGKDLPSLPKSQSRRRKLGLQALVAMCIVAALAVAGGVGGYFGHRALMQHKNPAKLTIASAGSAPASNSTIPMSGNGNGAPPAPSSGGAGGVPKASNPAFALNGTTITSLTYSAASDRNPTQQNYVVFYQYSNGDIRKVVYNESAWHPSTFVTSGARIGTGLSAFYLGTGPLIYLYYVDETGYLQELRGQHASDVWINGTLGAATIQVSSSSSALSSAYVGPCTARGGLGWIFYESTDGVQEARWSADDDTWSKQNNNLFPELASSADLALMVDGGAWRVYGITKNLEVQEYVCSQCCQNASNTWQSGLTATAVTNSTLSLGGSGVGGPRYLYYQDPTSNLHELVNVGNQAGDGSAEYWVANVTSNGLIVQNITTQDSSTGVVVTPAMLGSKISMSAGFRGKTQQLFLFYQTNGSDITVKVRDVPRPGLWGNPVALPVGA